jgi:hypothetical protein
MDGYDSEEVGPCFGAFIKHTRNPCASRREGHSPIMEKKRNKTEPCESQDTSTNTTEDDGRRYPGKAHALVSRLTRSQLNGRSGNTPGSRTALEEDGIIREM